ncbi:MAG TPA: beta-glucosidase, partial [Chitinophagaceae bacterium]
MKFKWFVLALILTAGLACSHSKKISKIEDQVKFNKEDEAMFTNVQRQTFQYFWDGAEPNSGLARE